VFYLRHSRRPETSSAQNAPTATIRATIKA
jgi:hypothetical protein